MRFRHETPGRLRDRQRRSRGIVFGSIGTTLSLLAIGIVMLLLVVAFPLDWLRPPSVTASSETRVISPNGDGDHDVAIVKYTLSEQANVTIRVLNQAGNLVRLLVEDEKQSAGQSSVTWDGRDNFGQVVNDGGYRLEVTAQGTARSTSSRVNIEVDTEPPPLQLANLPESHKVKGANLVVQGVTAPGATVHINGVPQDVVVDSQGKFSLRLKLQEGSNRLSISAIDEAGNTTSLVREVTLLTQPPQIVIESPVADSWTNQPVTQIRGTVAPGTVLKINGQQVPVAGDGSFSGEILLNEGENLIRYEATDEVGNVSIEEQPVYLKTKPPPLALNLEEGMVMNDSTLQVSGQTEAGALLKVNGQTITVDNLGGFHFTLNLLEGENLVEVEARDRVGNKTVQNRTIRYQQAPPESAFSRLLRNLPRLPLLLLIPVIAIPLLFMFLGNWTNPVTLSLSVDRQTFAPGEPGEGKMLVMAVDLSRPARTSVEVLDGLERPVALILNHRNRSAGQHLFVWDGYDDYGRVVPPGEYIVQATARAANSTVSSAVQVSVVEPAEMETQPLWQRGLADARQEGRVIPLRQERRTFNRTGE
jgi:flagellar hook assembly protein FlgD